MNIDLVYSYLLDLYFDHGAIISLTDFPLDFPRNQIKVL